MSENKATRLMRLIDELAEAAKRVGFEVRREKILREIGYRTITVFDRRGVVLAAVYLNDRFMGHVDEFSTFAQGLLLNPGTYEVKIVPIHGANPGTKTVTIEENKTALVK